MNDLLSQLRAAVGATHVLTEGDLSAYEIDWRQRARGKALAVVRPGSTAEVAGVVVVGAQQNLERPAATHEARQVLGATGARNHAERWFELAEYR